MTVPVSRPPPVTTSTQATSKTSTTSTPTSTHSTSTPTTQTTSTQTTSTQTTSTQTTNPAATFGPGFARERRLEELVLGGRSAAPILTPSTRNNAPAPGRVHEVRLAASGMQSATSQRLGDRPIPLPTALPGGGIRRVEQREPAWQAREMMN